MQDDRHATALNNLDFWGIQEAHKHWLKQFKKNHGRMPRVLGIGNLANNAFKNAVALRSLGVECDVFCHDYYHAMGCPEWEVALFDSTGLNMDVPNWSTFELGGYERPRWFAQGTMSTCIDYLIAKNNMLADEDALWERLRQESEVGGKDIVRAPLAKPLSPLATELVSQRLSGLFDQYDISHIDINELHFTYQSLFIDKFRWDQLFSHYDVVIGYATHGLYPLFSGTVPFIAYEHGTIRTLPFTDTLAGKLCRLVYLRANNVLITNCDNVNAAQLMKLREYRFIPHAVLEDCRAESIKTGLRNALLQNGKHDFIVFHPSRQHWSAARDLNLEKGNDIFIKGFARFVKKIRPAALLVLVNWGEHVDDTRKLLEELGITANIKWIDPLPIRAMSDYIAASDVLADQFIIGAWGALMPIGLMLGVPTMCYVNEDVHRWCFPEMPPVLNASTIDEVFDSLRNVTDQNRAYLISAASVEWYDKYHSMAVVCGRLVDAIRSAVECYQYYPASANEMEPPIFWLASKLLEQSEQSERLLSECMNEIEVIKKRLHWIFLPLRLVRRQFERFKSVLHRC